MIKISNIYKFIIKCLISAILMLVVLILMKSNSKFKNTVYKEVYNNNFSFNYLNNVYKKYIGDFKIIDDLMKTTPVSKEKTTYTNKEKYLDGVKLTVGSNYAVPLEKSGIVVFIGEKEGYNNTIIVQRIDGIDEWYGNINNTNLKLYDYVEEGTIIGEVNNELYLVYKKDGNVLNYEEYLK